MSLAESSKNDGLSLLTGVPLSLDRIGLKKARKMRSVKGSYLPISCCGQEEMEGVGAAKSKQSHGGAQNHQIPRLQEGATLVFPSFAQDNSVADVRHLGTFDYGITTIQTALGEGVATRVANPFLEVQHSGGSDRRSGA